MYMFWPAPATPRSAVPQMRSFGEFSAAAFFTKVSRSSAGFRPLASNRSLRYT